jgi:KamA family protein
MQILHLFTGTAENLKFSRLIQGTSTWREHIMNWQDLIKDNITTADELREPLKLSPTEYEQIRREIEMFPMSVTKYYFSLIDPTDPMDPIRKMAIPSGHFELTDGVLDTSGEHSNTKLQGLQHKYRETALILTTSECAMLCRHCFRRRLVGKASEEIADDLDAARTYLLNNTTISNVLLSGGDAFLMSTNKIKAWLNTLVDLEQLDFIGFGTRTPVTFPQRILEDPELLKVLADAQSKKQIFIVTHFNHPKEITPTSIKAIRALQSLGIVIKNQTVLMRGINDDPNVLGTLLKQITSIGIVQHYIFQCRPVQGVKSRFQVPLLEGTDIVSRALAMQNGLGKSADYTLSHISGKIRILGKLEDGKLLVQYKQAKDPQNIGRIFSLSLTDDATWLPNDLT